MKNNRQEDFLFPVEVSEDRNGKAEIIDDSHPAYKQIGDIKRRVWCSLSLKDYVEYMKLTKTSSKENFLTKKALSLQFN